MTYIIFILFSNSLCPVNFCASLRNTQGLVLIKILNLTFCNFAWLTIEVQIILHMWAHFSGGLQNVCMCDGHIGEHTQVNSNVANIGNNSNKSSAEIAGVLSQTEVFLVPPCWCSVFHCWNFISVCHGHTAPDSTIDKDVSYDTYQSTHIKTL